MIARGFKPMGWVAAVGGAALGCYMLSLQVATERNDLARVERQIIATKQQIRSLQTELGTRGRLSQLEQWNAEVLALSAPASGQFLESSFTLARFDQTRTIDPTARVQMASAETAPTGPPAAPTIKADPAPQVEPSMPRARMASAPATQATALVHRAGLVTAAPSPAKLEEAPKAAAIAAKPRAEAPAAKAEAAAAAPVLAKAAPTKSTPVKAAATKAAATKAAPAKAAPLKTASAKPETTRAKTVTATRRTERAPEAGADR
jgi:hypothetical protein